MSLTLVVYTVPTLWLVKHHHSLALSVQNLPKPPIFPVLFLGTCSRLGFRSNYTQILGPSCYLSVVKMIHINVHLYN